MEKILTISVAAYNVEKFLENTLTSLSDSRYIDKLEVFIIDDGGKDGSLEIAKKYEQKYPHTFKAIHKENGGYGSTVNYSIKNAAGKYFKLLDGDDWMDKDGLNEVLNRLENCDEDIVVTDYYVGSLEDGLKIIPTRNKDNSTVNVRNYKTYYPHGMWALFYKTSMLKSCNLNLPEHTLYTDQIYSTIPFASGKNIKFYSVPVYCYRIGREEQSTSRPSRIKHADEMFEVCRILYEFYNKNKEDNQYLLSRVSRYYVVALKTLLIFPVSQENRKRLIEYENNAKNQYYELYKEAAKNNNMGKLIFLMRLTAYRAYWLLKYVPYRYMN